MNNPELRAVLTEALKAHKPTMKRISHPRRQGFLLNLDACIGCEWTEQDGGDHDSHVADVIASLPGVAVIQLPEVDRGWATRNAWTVDESYVVAETDVGVVLEGDDTVTALRVETATRLAAALLAAAAAVVAEGEA
ncbi:hypothetical protein M184_gp16 [Mycobacterium phage WIVsmall]|uniref:hypothetical protein n=1 Tax=Mycobacterium phage WIVsmall TaxID=1327036 RepID=UPI00032B374E|nr:hypothetical protein M184_gp16 [Mycobacterium phage WIVsmall]AGK88164.1 hypothetical protein WIVsmall_16 [Mycobacterium phage WIVsmall]